MVAQHWFKIPFGWTGVDLFFILSGYLLGGILLDNRSSAGYFSTFYMRRAFRILPLYWLLLAISFADPITCPYRWQYLTFTQNFAWASGDSAACGPTSLTWSLDVEEQFYLLLPLLIRFVPAPILPRIFLCLIGAAPICRAILVHFYGNALSAYALLPGRMDALFAGTLIAWIVRQPDLMASDTPACAPVVDHCRPSPPRICRDGAERRLRLENAVDVDRRIFHGRGWLWVRDARDHRRKLAPGRRAFRCARSGSARTRSTCSTLSFLKPLIMALRRTTGLRADHDIFRRRGRCRLALFWWLIERPLMHWARGIWRFGPARPLYSRLAQSTDTKRRTARMPGRGRLAAFVTVLADRRNVRLIASKHPTRVIRRTATDRTVAMVHSAA